MLMPTHLDQAKAYDADNNMEFLGIAGVTLPSFEANTVTLEGMGLMGSIDNPARGSFSSMKLSATFRGLTKENLGLMNNVKSLDFRASQNMYDTGLKKNKSVQVRVTATGPIATFDLGEAEIPGTMTIKADMEIYNLKVWLDKKLYVELDKWNSIYKVGGNDIISDILDNIT